MNTQEHIKQYLNKYHPHCSEFHQAVLEVVSDIADFYSTQQKYIKANILERMLEPDRIIRFRVCWEDDQGSIHVNRGWRVQFNNSHGAYKGGIRFHPNVTESILKFLGFEQCFKNILTGLPMGGAKGGSDFNPKGKSQREIMRFCQSFMNELYRHIGPDIDVPAGDINVGDREIGFMFGHYLKLTNRWEGVMTGKSPTFGGSCGRTEATGHGVVYFIEEMLEHIDQSLTGKCVIISGSGNVAIHTAEKCIEKGAKVLCLSDSDGTRLFDDGISTDILQEIKHLKFEKKGRLSELKTGTFQKDQKPWSIKADIAIPCATENEMDEDQAKQLIENGIMAVVEGANMPLTASAQDLLLKQNIIYVPGKLANAGGVAVSGLERTQNAALTAWSLDKVDKSLKEIMKEIHKRAIQHIDPEQKILQYRKGANIYSFKKLADTMLAFGVQ